MGHTALMAKRLPSLYREGELVQGLLAVAGLQLEILDEEAIRVQRAHWFDTTLERSEAAALAAALDMAPEPWQGLAEFRTWVHALRNAMLRHGAVTRRALQGFVQEYVEGYRAASGTLAVPPITSWSPAPAPARPAFIENPQRRRYVRAPEAAGIEPLHRFTVEQRGLDETRAAFLLTGLTTAPEYVPVIANLTTGQALVFLGSVPEGGRLWIRPASDGFVEAQLEGEDVTGRIRSVAGLTPGTPWSAAEVEGPARALTLARGTNELWFLPVAHFDESGLDRALLALADLLLAQGRYDRTQFDHALFAQEAAVILRMTWLETQPAAIDIDLPGGALVNRSGELEESLVERERLAFSLGQAVARLKAAGVRAAVTLRPFGEVQGQVDRMTAVLPLVHREVGPSGADDLPDTGGLFEVTSYDDSTYR